MNANTGTVHIHGREYQTVAFRVHKFREEFPAYAILTNIVERSPESVAMRAEIADENGRTLATGFAEEYRNASRINKTSALENAETSAIGRALAAFGLGGTEYATADEVANAINQQQEGQRQGDDQGTVNPPASEQYDFPDGPATGITQLKSMTRELWREVEGCGDDGMLAGLLEAQENKLVIEQLENLQNPAHREIWEGDGKDNPGLKGLIERKRAQFKSADMQALSGGQYKEAANA